MRETSIMAVNGLSPYLKCGHFASRASTSESFWRLGSVPGVFTSIVHGFHGSRKPLENVPQLCEWAQTVAPGEPH